MKEAIIHAGPKVEIRDTPIPKAGPHQVVTKIVYSGSNPKDWYVCLCVGQAGHSAELTLLFPGKYHNGCHRFL